LQDVQLLALLFSVELWIVNVGDQFFDLHIGGDDAGRLKFRWQEAVAPESGAYHNFGAGPQDDIAGKIFVLRAEAVKHPRTHGWTDRLDVAGVHLEECWLMVRHVRPHRADDATIVDDLCDIRERLVDIDAALAAFAEAEWRRHEPAVFLFPVKLPLRFLAFMFLQSR